MRGGGAIYASVRELGYLSSTFLISSLPDAFEALSLVLSR